MLRTPYSIRRDLAQIAAYRRAEAIRTTIEAVVIGLVAIGAVAYSLAFCGALKPFL